MGLRPAPVAGFGSASGIVQQVNAFRATLGLPAFRTNGTLAIAAQQQADYMADTGLFVHTGYGGSTPQDRANAAGYNGRVVENIVGGWRMTPEKGLIWWQNSPIHYNAITSSRYTEIGGGYRVVGDQVYYAIVLGLPGGAPGRTAVSASSGTDDQPPPIRIVPLTLAQPDENGTLVHTLQAGQSLWMVAAHYDVPLANLYSLNSFGEDDVIPEGTDIIIKLAEGQAPPPTPTPPLTHIVREGETAWGIASRYNLSLSDLLWYNNLPQDVLLQPGDEVRVRLVEGEALPPTPTPVQTHQVVAGDTLLAIALRYNIAIEDLLAWNGLEPGAFLQVGQVLAIRPPLATATPTATPTVPATAVPTATATPTAVLPITAITPAPKATATAVLMVPTRGALATVVPAGENSMANQNFTQGLVVLGVVLLVAAVGGAWALRQ